MNKEQTLAAVREKTTAAQAIFDQAKAAGRPCTDAERAQISAFASEAKSLTNQYKLTVSDEDMRRKLDSLDGPEFSIRNGFGDQLFSRPTHAWASKAADHIMRTASQAGVKALVSGSIDVPAPIGPLVTIPDQPTTVLDLVPRPSTLTGNAFEYTQQTVRTNNAAVVADSALKPTSIYTFDTVQDRARVVATLTENIPERILTDHDALTQVLSSQMSSDVMEALEEEFLSGDGTGEHFTGLMHADGTSTQAFSTDLLTTCRKARSTLSLLRVVPTAWVFNPADLETIDLTVDNNGRPYDDATLARWLGTYPRISSVGIAAGTAVLANWTDAAIYPREDMKIDADRSGSNFTHNLVTLRAELRTGLAFLKPDSFCIVDLTA